MPELIVNEKDAEQLKMVWPDVVMATQKMVDAVEGLYEAFAPPKNIPHDPSLRKDRRKWGGR